MPSKSGSGPATAESTLRSMTTFSSISFACSSAHSVEPTRPYSSASQLAYTRVRRGFQPFLTAAPIARHISRVAAVPLPGSTAP